MTSLDKHIDSINFFGDFNSVNNLLKNAEVKTSFWGSRLIEVQGYSGSVRIDESKSYRGDLAQDNRSAFLAYNVESFNNEIIIMFD